MVFETQEQYALNLGTWIWHQRIELKLSGHGAAKLAGVHANTLYRWESGIHMPSAWQVYQLKTGFRAVRSMRAAAKRAEDEAKRSRGEVTFTVH